MRLKLVNIVFLMALIVNVFMPFYSLVFARPLVADTFPRKINIDHNFTGTDILVYGARNGIGNIVIVVRGPVAELVDARDLKSLVLNGRAGSIPAHRHLQSSSQV
jgi:hypothetical protein